MSVRRHTALIVTAALALPLAASAAPSALQVTVAGIRHGKAIPASQALCTPNAEGRSDKVTAASRPTIRWSGAPQGTQSFAVFMMDPDVPADFTNAGKPGKTIAEGAKRQDFFHYGIVTLPAEATMLPGSGSAAKPDQGVELPNDLGLAGYVPTPAQYGGPCPPWNDERLHHYHFVVLALGANAPVTLPPGEPNRKPGEAPNSARNTYNRLIASSAVLAKGETVGTYSLNPSLLKARK